MQLYKRQRIIDTKCRNLDVTLRLIDRQKMAYKESEVYQHNLKVLNSLEAGDLVEFERDVIKHWAVYVGNGYVIHLVTEDEKKSFLQGMSTQLSRSRSILRFSGASLLSDNASSTKGSVWKQRFFDVAVNTKAKKNNFLDGTHKPLDPKDIVTRAESLLEENVKRRLESKQDVKDDGTRQEESINSMNDDERKADFYDLFKKNCEHFVTWCRYGVPFSEQAEKAARFLQSLDNGVRRGATGVAVGAAVAGAMAVMKWLLK